MNKHCYTLAYYENYWLITDRKSFITLGPGRFFAEKSEDLSKFVDGERPRSGVDVPPQTLVCRNARQPTTGASDFINI